VQALTRLQELRKQYQIISDLRAEIKSLQADNLKLYEKVRYMQSYREDSTRSSMAGHHSEHAGLPSSSAYPMSRSSSGGGMAVGDVEDGMGKYHSRYEESVNPFEVFRGRVSRGFSALIVSLILSAS
jgi:homeobox protein cut-like